MQTCSKLERPITNPELLKPPFIPVKACATLAVRNAILDSPRYQAALHSIERAMATSWQEAERFVVTFQTEARHIHDFVAGWDAQRYAHELRAMDVPAVAGAFRRGLKQVCMLASRLSCGLLLLTSVRTSRRPDAARAPLQIGAWTQTVERLKLGTKCGVLYVQTKDTKAQLLARLLAIHDEHLSAGQVRRPNRTCSGL